MPYSSCQYVKWHVLSNHDNVHTYGEDREAFDYQNEVKRFNKTQCAFKISETKSIEINSDKLKIRSTYTMHSFTRDLIDELTRSWAQLLSDRRRRNS